MKVILQSQVEAFRAARFDAEILEASPDAELSCFLLPAMKSGTPLSLSGAPSSALQRNVPALIRILSEWNRTLIPVEVTWEGAEPSPGRRRDGVGCFFSGGADSFYTLVARQSEITHLVFVHGWDIGKSKSGLWDEVWPMLHEVATAFNKPLILVKTNHRGLLNAHVPWGTAHGAAIATVAHLLRPYFGRVIIPSSYTTAQLHPWGTHPALDPLWSGDAMELEHDTVEVSRVDKTIAIAQNRTAMRWLRVCFRNTQQAYNCGKCPKCMRTRIALEIAGARCENLPPRLTVDEILEHYDPTGKVERFFAEELRDAAPEPYRSALAQVLEKTARPD